MTLRGEVDDLLSRLGVGEEEGWFGSRLCPVFDLSDTDTDTDNAIAIEMDLPGIDPEGFDINLVGNTLSVRGVSRRACFTGILFNEEGPVRENQVPASDCSICFEQSHVNVRDSDDESFQPRPPN